MHLNYELRTVHWLSLTDYNIKVKQVVDCSCVIATAQPVISQESVQRQQLA